MASLLFDRQSHLFGVISRTVVNLKKQGSARITKGTVIVKSSRTSEKLGKIPGKSYRLLKYASEKDYKDNVYFVSDLYVKCEEAFYYAKATLTDWLEEIENENKASHSDKNGSDNSTRRPRNLPNIQLPSFSGKYTEWISYRDLFSSMVGSDSNIPAVEKMQYLKTTVTGEAAQLISNLPIQEDSYQRAWQILTSRYENKRALINSQLDRLFALHPVITKSATALNSLRSTVNGVLEALKALGGPVDKWDYFLVYFVCKRLDEETHEAWEMKVSAEENIPTYSELDSFLDSRIRALESIKSRVSTKSKPISGVTPGKQSQTARAFTTSTSSEFSVLCTGCGEDHYLGRCTDYKRKSPEQRMEFLKQKQLCFNCLGKHRSGACTSQKRCMVCGQKHHTTIHIRHTNTTSLPTSSANQSPSGLNSSARSPVPVTPGLTPPTHSTTTARNSAYQTSPQLSPAAVPFTPDQQQVNTSGVHHWTSPPFPLPKKPRMILATAIICVVSPQGQEITARALIDQGSELSFVSESIVQTLQLPRHPSSVSLFGVGYSRSGNTRGSVDLLIRSCSDPKIEYLIEAHILPRVTADIPSSLIQIDDRSHLADLKLADPSFATPGCIDVLLGVEIYGKLLKGDIRRGSAGAPIAQDTTLGWIVSGPASTGDPDPSHSLCVSTREIDDNLHELVQNFWTQEAVIMPEETRSCKEDVMCEEHFRASHYRNPDGRYVVRLFLRTQPTSFGNSREIANNMLQRTVRRFPRNSAFQKLYIDFLQEYESLGHMEQIETPGHENFYYLPHHGVLRESSLTTKLRVVFNGSQKTNVGYSLNECLYQVPNYNKT